MKYKARDYEVRIRYDADDQIYVAQVVDIPTVMSHGKTIAEAGTMIAEALGGALEAYVADGEIPPAPGSREVNAFARKGGLAVSRKKRLAAIANGTKGGRPPRKLRTSLTPLP
jgi:predicted RNase H-like HicB family nuclease